LISIPCSLLSLLPHALGRKFSGGLAIPNILGSKPNVRNEPRVAAI